MNLQESNWVEYKLPCPSCGGSDPVAMNKNGSAKCFSCDAFFPNYNKDKPGVVKKIRPKENYNTNLNVDGSSFGAFGTAWFYLINTVATYLIGKWADTKLRQKKA